MYLAVHIPFAYQGGLELSLPMSCGVSAVGIVFSAVIAYFVGDALSVVPVEHQRGMTPGQVWLLIIPFFNLIWNFFVFQRVSDSFRSYFESVGRPQLGDYGKQMGLIYAILVACAIVPCLGLFAWIAGLVMGILLIVKFQEYKKLIVSSRGGGFPVVMPLSPE